LSSVLAARLRAGDVVALYRPRHWVKNLFCFAGAVFSTLPVTSQSLLDAGLVFLAFCFAASAIYALNDIADADRDRQHAAKRDRPVASGRLAKSQAGALAMLAATAAAIACAFAPPKAVLCLVLYVGVNAAYSASLKHVAIIDVFCIASGFLLRLFAGVYAIGDAPTAWITLCTFFLALFLGFAKRRSEFATHATGHRQRPALVQYSLDFLNLLVVASSTMAVVSYAVFTTTGGRDPTLAVTVLPVVYAVFHYERLTLLAASEQPERLLLKDRVLWLCITLWVGGFSAISHYQPAILR
jgi:4-hydroxybenzoate polyprenyltransferase